MRVTIEDINRRERELGFCRNPEEGYRIMQKYMDDHCFRPFYTRVVDEGYRKRYDVGSRIASFNLYEV